MRFHWPISNLTFFLVSWKWTQTVQFSNICLIHFSRKLKNWIGRTVHGPSRVRARSGQFNFSILLKIEISKYYWTTLFQFIFSWPKKLLNSKWVSENASFFHFSNFKINQKIRKILFMAKKDILSIFHFSVFLSNRKNAKMELSCGHFLFFDFSVFNRKRKKQKIDI